MHQTIYIVFRQVRAKWSSCLVNYNKNFKRKMGSLSTSDPSVVNLKEECKGHEQNSMDVGLIQRKNVGELLLSNSSPKLFTPLTIRGITFHNRIFVSPMCMYSCEKQDGIFTDFHLAHYGNLALRGPSLVVIEATSVEPRGRLSPQDSGIWGPEHVEPLRRIAELVHASGSKLGIQIAHGGRKAGTRPPYYMYEENGGRLTRDFGIVPKSEGGFPDELIAASPIPWKEELFPTPKEPSTEEVEGIVQKFADAARRAVEAGVDVIEIHAAHGYLIHNFLSGNTNKRTDKYGGSTENRLRFLLEIVTAVRAVIPKDMPLFCRVSGTDFVNDNNMLSPDPNGWDINQVIELCRKAVPLGLDLIDISSGNNLSGKKGVFGPDYGFHVPLSEAVKKAGIEGLIVGGVGGLNSGKFSDQVLQEGKIDVTFVGREFIKNPNFVYSAAEELGVNARRASQYSWMWPLINPQIAKN